MIALLYLLIATLVCLFLARIANVYRPAEQRVNLGNEVQLGPSKVWIILSIVFFFPALLFLAFVASAAVNGTPFDDLGFFVAVIVTFPFNLLIHFVFILLAEMYRRARSRS